jgi:hypothetical protein
MEIITPDYWNYRKIGDRGFPRCMCQRAECPNHTSRRFAPPHPAHRQLDTGGAAAALSVPICGYLQPCGGLPVVGLLYLSRVTTSHPLFAVATASTTVWKNRWACAAGVILGHRTGETQLRSYLAYLLRRRNHFDSGPARENV